MHTYIHAHIHTYIHTCVCVRVCVCVCANKAAKARVGEPLERIPTQVDASLVNSAQISSFQFSLVSYCLD